MIYFTLKRNKTYFYLIQILKVRLLKLTFNEVIKTKISSKFVLN